MVTANKKKLLNADGRIWISTAEGKFIGKGRIELMEKIKQLGSIRQAALAMQMSYRQAWQLIDDMNSKAKTPLVTSSRGGKGGGNAVITSEGEKFINLFNDFNKKFQKLLAQQSEKFIL
jgi:molybdate transport system regulatory protein